jgi:hypothetical protein
VRALEQYLDESSTPVTAPASREGR